jgi:hypothetical protein
MIAAKSSTPGAAANFLVAIQALLRYAIAVGLRTDDPTIGIRRPKIRSAGIYTWTEQDIAAFEAFHPIGSRARLALALLLYTAQRRSGHTGAATHPGWCHPYSSAQNRQCAPNPNPSRTSAFIGCDASRKSNVFGELLRQASYSRRIRSLVSPRMFQGRGAEVRFGPWIAQGCLPTTCRSRLLGEGDLGNQWASEPERSRALHQSGRPSPHGQVGNLRCQAGTENWQTSY